MDYITLYKHYKKEIKLKSPEVDISIPFLSYEGVHSYMDSMYI